MDIKIKLNDLKYRYDVYQMFNIYFPLDEIKFEDDGEYLVEVIEEEIRFSYKNYNKSTKIGEKIKEDIKRLVFISLKELTNIPQGYSSLVNSFSDINTNLFISSLIFSPIFVELL